MASESPGICPNSLVEELIRYRTLPGAECRASPLSTAKKGPHEAGLEEGALSSPGRNFRQSSKTILTQQVR